MTAKDMIMADAIETAMDAKRENMELKEKLRKANLRAVISGSLCLIALFIHVMRCKK